MKSQRCRICFNVPIRLVGAAALLLILVMGNSVLAQSQDVKDVYDMVVNGETRTYLEGPQGRESLRGRVSGHLRFTEESLGKAIVLVEALNWVVFGVDQESITRVKPQGKPTSSLGFTIAPREPQVLK